MVTTTSLAIVCLQETKLQDVLINVVRQCLGAKFEKFFYLSALGTRGGILVTWDATITQLSNQHYMNHTLTVLVKCPDDEQPWWLTCVYGLQEVSDKVEFLQDLVDIRDLHVGPWLVAGDFNLIAREEDKNNALINRRMLGRFRAKLNFPELK